MAPQAYSNFSIPPSSILQCSPFVTITCRRSDFIGVRGARCHVARGTGKPLLSVRCTIVALSMGVVGLHVISQAHG